MTCGSCEARVNTALNALPGVTSAKASTANKNVVVEYDPTKVTTVQMVAAIEKAGYKPGMPQ